MKKKLDLNRRSVLKGAGSIAVALPWLEAMAPTKAFAQSEGTAKRFLTVYTPGGTVRDKWASSGTETNFNFGPILQPLNDLKSRILIPHGLDMKSAVGEQHQSGIIAFLTGTNQNYGRNGYSGGPSVDQVIANMIGNDTPMKSLQIAIRWATGKSHGLLHPINALNFEDNGRYNPIPPRLDPQATWNDLFGTLDNTDPAALALLNRRKSVLDFVGKRYQTLTQQLGANDRERLDQHLTKIREIENALESEVVAGGACQKPERVNTSDYNPTSGLNSADDGALKDNSTDRAIPKVGTLMMDMIVMAMTCDITRVATLQWTDTEAKHTFPWLGLSDHHHYYQHDGGFRPNECQKIYTWYAEQHAYLLQKMADTDMGGASLLDESVVLIGSELSDPPTHDKKNMPFLLAGNGGGMRTGRMLNFNGRSHNDLLSGILNLFGKNVNAFGDTRYTSGAINNLT